MKILVRIVITAAAIGLSAWLLSNYLNVVSDGSTGGMVLSTLVVAVIYGLVNMIIKPIVQLLSLPLYILTLGLFTLLVNALMLWITTLISNADWFFGNQIGLEVNGGFWWFVLGALVISIIQMVLTALLPKKLKD
ncbi:phage holin family protein [Antribacter gilvus]|uniref:phage holin family protein n=1 Tax=Antribacter gilvus TaxID=2304675 RepID=UPI000F776197|nr:phage holin family protein [Antribacter gilvus]